MSAEGEQKHDDRYLSTGCEPLDELLGGGFERGVVSQVYGLPSTGKTNICLQTSVEAIRSGGSVVYIDTEGISLERFKQIAGDDYEEIAREFIMKDVYDFEEQIVAVRDVENLASEVDLVVLDSATGLYRVEEENEDEDSPLKRLNRQITHLTSLARKHDIGVVVTNQVYTDVDDNGGEDKIRPLGGNMMQHWTKTILRLEKPALNGRKREIRRATLEKHRSKSPGKSAQFVISDNGIEEG